MRYKISEFAELIHVSIKTLQRWDREKILVADRTPTNHRVYTDKHLRRYLGEPTDSTLRKTVIYSRVSSKNRKDDLVNQTKFLQDFANARGMIVDEIIEEFGSGLNYNRKRWNALLEDALSGKIDAIIVSHRDRFVRFGFDFFERLCTRCGAQIIVVQNEKLSPNEELVQDVISILHVFSCRLYGFRKYKKMLKGDESLDQSVQNRVKADERAGA